ncbi:MAG: ATP-binding protein, partial [Woeseia sp.]
LAIIAFTPLVTWFLLPQLRERWLRKYSTELPYFIATAFLVSSLAIYAAPLDDSISGNATRAALSVLVASPLLWAALRFPYPVVGFSMLAFVVASIVLARRGFGPLAFASENLVANMSVLQAHILTVVQATILLAFGVRERKRALDDVNQNHRFQSIVLTLSDKLIAASASELEVRIDAVLGDIGEFTNSDRVVLLQLDNEREQVASMHRWNRPSVTEQTIDVTGRKLRDFGNVTRHIEQNGYVALADIRSGFGNLPKAVAEELQPVFNVTGSTQSAIYIGLFTGGRLIGCIGCSWIRPGVWWTNESLSLLYLLGQLLANVLHRKSVELALQSYQDRLRSMASEVSLSEERARRQAAIDLHDGIGQNLAVARMRIGQILASQPEESEQWRVARELIDQALLGTRHVIADLSPAILYELGLVPAIQSLADNFRLMHDIDCEVIETGASWLPSEDQKVMLHRNVRELLSNVARHSKANAVTIRIDWLDKELRIEVADNGIGMDAPADPAALSVSGGFGLFSIRETVIQAGGTFHIDAVAGKGTAVRLRVPQLAEFLVA